MALTEHLRQQLVDYGSVDAAEESFRARMLALLDTPAPFSREQLDPGHFTASAFVLSPARDSVLLIHHRKLVRWLQPGGHIEASDRDVVAAARREVTEEVRTTGELTFLSHGLFDLDIHEIPARDDAAAHEHFDLRFLFALTTLEIGAGDEVDGARWVSLADFAGIESDRSLMRAVEKLRFSYAVHSGELDVPSP